MYPVFDGLLCVSIAVESLENATADYQERLGLVPMGPVYESQRGYALRWRNFGNGDTVMLELLEATSPTSPVARFLREHGEGVYQVRLATGDLLGTATALKERGSRVIGADDPEQTPELCWIHPASTHGVLIELVQTGFTGNPSDHRENRGGTRR
ncbi:MAG: hypothetical protein GEV10_24735 [Streptosporangiales bacterium]|nr:hypothetical protein [Streptosporangiales bacterium]